MTYTTNFYRYSAHSMGYTTPLAFSREKQRKKMFFSQGTCQVYVLLAVQIICTMGALSVTQLYDSLSVKLGKETAENLTTFIELKIDKELESKLSMLATKDDLAKAVSDLSSSMNEYRRESKEDYMKLTVDFSRLETRIDKLESKLTSEINRLESHFDSRFNKFENRLVEKMVEYRYETIKWVIGLLVTLATLLFLYLKIVI